VASFSDDFNRADSTDLGPNWVEVSGDWSIISNQLSPGTTGTTVVLRAATAMATNNNFAQITIATTVAVTQGVWCRGDATLNNGYMLRNNGTSWDLFSVVSGSFVNIGTFAAAAVNGDVVKIQANGTTITAFINGTQRITATNSAVATGTNVGIRSQATSGLRYDNFTAADLSTGVTGDAAVSSTATLSATGLRAAAGAAALAPTASLAASGIRGASGAASLAASAFLTASGAIGTTSGGGVAVSVGLQASGQVAGVVVRGTARGAAGAGPLAQRGEPVGPRAQRGESAVPTARGGAL
jgi:hypothetical protein